MLRLGSGSSGGLRPAVFGGTGRQRVEHVTTQAPAVGVADVVDPAADAGIELGNADQTGVIGNGSWLQAESGFGRWRTACRFLDEEPT